MVKISSIICFVGVKISNVICPQKPAEVGVVVAALQIVQPGFGVEVVASIPEGVDGGDVDSYGIFIGGGGGGIVGNCTGTPCVVGVAGYGFSALVGDGDYVTLQVFQEVVGDITAEDAADVVLIVVKGSDFLFDILTLDPLFPEDFGTVQRVGMLDSTHRLGGTDAAGVVGVDIAAEGLKLSALFPDQGVAQIGGGGNGCF